MGFECINYISNQIISFVSDEYFKEVNTKAIVVDFDDTLVSSSTRMPITPIVNAIKDAQKKGFLIYIVTARSPESKAHTFGECYLLGIHPANIFTSINYGKDPKDFKITLMRCLENISPQQSMKLNNSQELLYWKDRTSIANNDEKIKIMLTIGDQWSDVGLPYTIGIKLPTQHDPKGFLVLNNYIKQITVC